MKKSAGVILVLIIVLLLGVIGVGGYFLVKENNNTNSEIGELKNEIANLKKNLENTSNDQFTDDIQTNNVTTTVASNITEQEAIKLGNELYKLTEDYYTKVTEIHTEIVNQTIGDEEGQVKIKDKSTMDLIKNKLIHEAYQNLTEYFNITEKNGEYYITNAGMGANPRYLKTEELKIESIENNKITYIATSEYDDTPQTKEYPFIITKIDGEWKIEQFTLPY